MTYIFSRINKHQRPFFYRDKRVLLSFLVSLPILYMGYVFPAVVAHLAIGVFCDVWFFSHKKVKESDVTSSVWLDAVGMTPEMLDKHSKVFMWLRHGAFFVCSIAAITYFFFDVGIDSFFNFIAAYFFFRFFTGYYLVFQKMIYPWVGAIYQTQGGEIFVPHKRKDSTYSSIFNNQRVNPFKEDFSVKPLCMTDPMNIMGLTNMSSPNYIGRDYNNPTNHSIFNNN